MKKNDIVVWTNAAIEKLEINTDRIYLMNVLRIKDDIIFYESLRNMPNATDYISAHKGWFRKITAIEMAKLKLNNKL